MVSLYTEFVNTNVKTAGAYAPPIGKIDCHINTMIYKKI